MELKSWLLGVRILNCLCAAMLLGFQIWFLVALFETKNIWNILLRVWAPIFIIMLAVLILTAQFKYDKIVEHFKFLQWLPGVALFNLLQKFSYLVWHQFLHFSSVPSTKTCILRVYHRASIVLASLFVGLAFVFGIFSCLKPPGSRGLLSEELGVSL